MSMPISLLKHPLALHISASFASACPRAWQRSVVFPSLFSREGLTSLFKNDCHISHQIRAFGAPVEQVSEAPRSDWRAPWRELLNRLHGSGHFSGDAHVTLESIELDKGALKRAVLSFARQRADILQSLTHRHLKALIAAGPPGQADRKTKNAYRRLVASILDGSDLPPGDGGPADLQDVLRMILALSTAEDATDGGGNISRVACAAAELLPEILVAMDSAPQGQETMSEKAKNIERMRQGGSGAASGAS